MEYATADQEIDFAETDPTGRYLRYHEILGEGAFKTVYKAFDQVDGMEVAWNVIDINKVSPSPQQMEQLYTEMSILRSVNHKNLMKFHSSWMDDEKKTINMITELLTSGSLRQYRNKHKKLDIKAVKNWARQILGGLQYLHSHTPQIIHRDIKCDNIFVNGYSGKVKIGDLGFAMELKEEQQGRNANKSVIGTPEFMAPELYEEEYNELIDIYSFGMCILELVTGEYPYVECKNHAQIYKRVTAGIKPTSLGEVVDPEVKQFIEKCLVPASIRPSAAQLLNDSFLSLFNTATKEGQLNTITGDPNSTNMTCRRPAYHELETFKENTGFWLKGQQTDDHVVSLTLRLKDSRGINTVEFAFSLDSDTALSIASEMAKEVELGDKVASVIAELLEDLIKKIVPSWKPFYAKKQSEYFDISETSFIDNDKSDITGVSWYRQCFQDLLKEGTIFNAAKDVGIGLEMERFGDLRSGITI